MRRLAALIVAFSSLAWPKAAAPPPAPALGASPRVVGATISPDGKRIATLGGAGDQLIVSIATIDQPGLPVVPLGSIEGVGVRWAGNDYVLARVAVWEKLGPRQEYRFE